MQAMPHDSLGTLKFSGAKDFGEIRTGSYQQGAKCKWGKIKIGDF